MSTFKSWDTYFKGIVEQVKTRSKDNSTKIGALVVGPDREIISTGYNSFPRGIDDNVPERQERPEKYYWFVHAEVNSIINAARNGVSTKGGTMYLTCGIPCANCAMAIINAGITRIVCNDDLDTITGGKGPQWDEHAKRSLIMFKEAGVKLDYYKHE